MALARVHEPGLVGDDHGLDAAIDAELGEDAADVGLDGARLEEQVDGDLGVAFALGDEEERLALGR